MVRETKLDRMVLRLRLAGAAKAAARSRGDLDCCELRIHTLLSNISVERTRVNHPVICWVRGVDHAHGPNPRRVV